MRISTRARAPSGEHQARCPYCLDSITPDEALDCDRCGTQHHAACFEAHGECTMLGCDGRPRNTAALLPPEEQGLLVTRARNLSGAPRARAVERLIRQGLQPDIIRRAFEADPDARIRYAVLGMRVEKGDGEALAELYQAAKDARAPAADRGEALRTIALMRRLPQGALRVVLSLLKERPLRRRAEWVLRRCEAAEIEELFEMAEQGELSNAECLEALTGMAAGLSGADREARLRQFMAFQQGARPLTLALIQAGLAGARLQSLPARPQAPSTEEWRSALIWVLAIGGVLSLSFLGLAWLLDTSSYPDVRDKAHLVKLGARSALALTILFSAGLALLISSRRNLYARTLALVQEEQQRHDAAYEDALEACRREAVEPKRFRESPLHEPRPHAPSSDRVSS